MQEGVLKVQLEKAKQRRDQAEASASLEERVLLNAEKVSQAKELQKAQVRLALWDCAGHVLRCQALNAAVCAGGKFQGRDPSTNEGEAGSRQTETRDQISVSVRVLFAAPAGRRAAAQAA